MYVLFFVLFFIVLIGLIKLRFYVRLDEKKNLVVFFRILFLKKYVYYKKSGENKKIGSRKKIKKKKHETDDSKKKKDRKSIFKNKNFVVSLVEPIPGLLKFLNKGFVITFFSLNLKVAKEEAKETALDYVKKVSFICNVVRIVCCFCNVKKKKISVLPDYVHEQSTICFILNTKISVGRIFLGVIIYMFRVLIKLMFKAI